MPYSFTQIEKDKTKTIGFVFSFLILFYFLSFWLIAVLASNYLQYQSLSYSSRNFFQFSFLGPSATLMILGIALVVGFGHWQYTTSNLIPKILGVLHAERINKNDTYHQVFQNIIDEVSVATGGQKMEGVVVPTMAMNAFALADFKGTAMIGVTEGMLARLSRAQLEAVIGHEAAHIVSGDCLATTVTTSLFELYGGLLKGLEMALRGSRRGYSSRGGGGAIALILFVYVLLAISRFMSQLVRMFISRQREYRADAVAVRLTRDPLSLAEALFSIAYHWRGAGLSAQELEAIFIMNPELKLIDENTNFFADLFSTHPPVEKRLQILLDMAHSNLNALAAKIKSIDNKPRVIALGSQEENVQWMVNKDGQWQGPFDLVQMMTFGWLRPDTWIKRIGEGKIMKIHEDQYLSLKINRCEGSTGKYQCPKCHLPLGEAIYEGIEVHKCSFCQGTLLFEKDVQKIIIRQEVGFCERVVRMAQIIKKEGRKWGWQKIKRDPKTLYPCQKCSQKKSTMLRMFYTDEYRVEVDKCIYCGLIWFDKDELEVLQYLIEEGQKKGWDN